MRQIVQASCPYCQSNLRVPAEWLDRLVKCKHCQAICQMRKREPIPEAIAFTPVAAAAPAAMPYTPGVPDAMPYTPQPVTPSAAWGAPPAAAPPAAAPPMYTPTAATLQASPWGAPAPAQAYSPPAAPYAPPAAAPPANDNPFTPSYGPTGTNRPRPAPKKNNSVVMVLGVFCSILFATVVVLVLSQAGIVNIPGISPGKTDDTLVAEGKGDTKQDDVKSNKNAIAATSSTFPRRLLSINIANYLYANPIHNGATKSNRAGDSIGGGAAAIIKQISDKWRIPKDQVFELSDSLVGQVDNAHIPLKAIIESTIKQFVATSRDQDRIVILFTGHAVMNDGKGYLVPLEGEIDDAKTLIPVEWFYEQLAECKAQQKFVILDVCRYDPGRGFERPGGGMMSEELDKVLHTAPEGVQVWTSCSPGQYSYEFDYSAYAGFEVRGSLFLSNFFYASSQGKLGKGIQKPDEVLPVEPLVEAVTARTSETAKALVGADQVPKMSGSPATTQVAFNAQEAPAKKIKIPMPPEGADKAEVAAIVDDIRVPGIKADRKDSVQIPLEKIFPFPVDVLKDYKDDGISDAEILQNPDKYPLRFETVLTVKLLRDLRDATNDKEQDLPEEFQGETGDEAKKQILALQRLPARIQALLERRLVQMEAAQDLKDKETNKRALANFDYALAELAMRVVYMNEYNLMLGKVRKDELPPLDMAKGHKGWRLAASEKLASSKEIRDKASEAKELLEGLIADHPNTPWAVFAKRERSTTLGLTWQASSFGRE